MKVKFVQKFWDRGANIFLLIFQNLLQAYTRLDFLNHACTGGLAALAINSIGIKEKENESAPSMMIEHGKDREANVIEIIQLFEREKDTLCSKIAMLGKENQAASSKIDELEKEKEVALSKVALLEREGEALCSKKAVLEKEIRNKEEKFGKYKNAQLRKEKELITKLQDFKRRTNAEHEKEKEAARSKIAMLEKELETKEVRLYSQAIRALKKIQDEDKEPTEKVKELTVTVQKLVGERNYWETLAKQLKGKESETAELVEAQQEMIRVFSDLGIGDMDIGVKKFGIVDSHPFRFACKQKFSPKIAEEKAIKLCSIWQTAVEDPEWYPFKTVISNGVQAEIIAREDKKLQQLREKWGDEVYLAVAIALTEIRKYNTKGRTVTHQLWNFKLGRNATLREAICLMGKQLKEAKIKDTGFVKVDQLEPEMEGKNLIVKVLNTNVVVDKREHSQPPYLYSNRRITRVAESLVGDETGAIIFTARNEQVDLMEPGHILVLYGAETQMYRGSMRLAVEHRAQITTAEPVEFVVNEDNNMSLTEYELVDVKEEE